MTPGFPLQIVGHQMVVWLRGTASVALSILRACRDTYVAVGEDPGGADAYVYLNRMFRRMHLQAAAPLRPPYTWGVLHGAFLAKNLGYQRISVAEFGVAGGQGLIRLENAAALIEEAFELKIDVYGFDTGVGCRRRWTGGICPRTSAKAGIRSTNRPSRRVSGRPS